MIEELPLVTFDDSAPVRYNWPEIKLLFMAGVGVSEMARNLTQNFPASFDRVRAAIAKMSSDYDWPSELQTLIAKTQAFKVVKNSQGGQINTDSPTLTETLNSLASERKARYLEITSKFADRAAKTLDQRQIESLEDAAMAAKLFQPVHELARDIHGLNGKDTGNQVQVNILSDWANKVPDFVNYVDAQDVAKDNT